MPRRPTSRTDRAPFTGSFRPEQPLARFNGKTRRGRQRDLDTAHPGLLCRRHRHAELLDAQLQPGPGPRRGQRLQRQRRFRPRRVPPLRRTVVHQWREQPVLRPAGRHPRVRRLRRQRRGRRRGVPPGDRPVVRQRRRARYHPVRAERRRARAGGLRRRHEDRHRRLSHHRQQRRCVVLQRARPEPGRVGPARRHPDARRLRRRRARRCCGLPAGELDLVHRLRRRRLLDQQQHIVWPARRHPGSRRPRQRPEAGFRGLPSVDRDVVLVPDELRAELLASSGLSGDVPIGLDLDGDGFSELCVWRPASGHVVHPQPRDRHHDDDAVRARR